MNSYLYHVERTQCNAPYSSKPKSAFKFRFSESKSKSKVMTFTNVRHIMKSMHTSNCGVTVWNVLDGERKQRDESV